MNAGLFQRILKDPATLQDVPLSEVEAMTHEWPWMGAVQLLLALKKREMNAADAIDAMQKAALFFSNPLWMHFQVDRFETKTSILAEEPRHESAATAAQQAVEQWNEEATVNLPEPATTVETETAAAETPLFEPLFAVDYFASQGIKLKEDAVADDKLSQQVKSFTQWLKSMKKIYVEEAKPMDQREEKEVIAMAADSNHQAEVLTEAMAEVLVMQQKTKQAIDLYRKLSLLHPEKSHYFASRIDILNQSK